MSYWATTSSHHIALLSFTQPQAVPTWMPKHLQAWWSGVRMSGPWCGWLSTQPPLALATCFKVTTSTVTCVDLFVQAGFHCAWSMPQKNLKRQSRRLTSSEVGMSSQTLKQRPRSARQLKWTHFSPCQWSFRGCFGAGSCWSSSQLEWHYEHLLSGHLQIQCCMHCTGHEIHGLRSWAVDRSSTCYDFLRVCTDSLHRFSWVFWWFSSDFPVFARQRWAQDMAWQHHCPDISSTQTRCRQEKKRVAIMVYTVMGCYGRPGGNYSRYWFLTDAYFLLKRQMLLVYTESRNLLDAC